MNLYPSLIIVCYPHTLVSLYYNGKAVLSLALIVLREKVAADKEEERTREKTTSQLGNSAEEIAQLKKDYDFSGVGVKERTEDQKWFQASRPSSSRLLAPDVTSSYYQWLKWNLTGTGKPSQTYKGHLVIKREETEAGAKMAAEMEVAAEVGVEMGAVRLE
jgi:hypothetical protein